MYLNSTQVSQRAFFGVSTLLFAVSTTVTIMWCGSMSAMREMPMPGGWAMSMTWMQLPGQSWFDAEASFLVMWVMMMLAMMLPSLVPMMWRYRLAVSNPGTTRLGRLTVLVGLGYVFVWTGYGLVVYPIGIALAAAAMQSLTIARSVPMVAGAVVLAAGMLQFTRWKAHHLGCCRQARGRDCTLAADAATALRHGLRLGFHCSYCCFGQIMILLVVGVMNLRAMAAVTAAITLERVLPAGERVAKVIGIVTVGAGLILILRAAGV